MNNTPVIDLHADTYFRKLMLKRTPYLKYFISKYYKGEVDFEENLMINNDRLTKGNVIVQTQSLYLSGSALQRPLHSALEIIDLVKKDIENNDNLIQIKEFSDIEFAKKNRKNGILLSIEGLEVIEDNFDLLGIFHELGVRIIAPTWNRLLPYFGFVGMDLGITERGKTLLKEMEKYNFILDVSHMSEKSFWDAHNLYKGQIIASHSNLKTFCDVPRNLTDDQVTALHERNSLFGINFYTKFLQLDSEIVMGKEEISRIINYVLEKWDDSLLAFGSDFDGISSSPEDLHSPADYPILAQSLLNSGIAEETIKKLFYKNAFNLFKRELI